MASSFASAVQRLRPALDPAALASIEALDAAAHAAWPDVTLDEESWAMHLASRLDGSRGAQGLDGAGLYLAAACLAGSQRAAVHLDAELRAGAAPALARLKLDTAAADEVLQRAREHLLVAREAAPRLATYSGRGALRDWLRTVAVRLASDLRRERKPEVDGEALLALPGGADPERDVVRASSKQHVTRALAEAFAALDAKQRALLRLHVVERLGIDDIAPLYGASRATIARWVADAREALGEATRARLADAIPSAELDSLMTSVRQSLDVSIERILREP